MHICRTLELTLLIETFIIKVSILVYSLYAIAHAESVKGLLT